MLAAEVQEQSPNDHKAKRHKQAYKQTQHRKETTNDSRTYTNTRQNSIEQNKTKIKPAPTNTWKDCIKANKEN